MKITGLSHLFKWENLHNWWLTKYFFAPLYVFSRRFYPKRLTVHSGYIFFGELNPQPFALLTQCSTTELQEHFSNKCSLGEHKRLLSETFEKNI